MIAKLFEIDGRNVVFIRVGNDEEEIEITVEVPENSMLTQFRTTLGFEGNQENVDAYFDKIDEELARGAMEVADNFQEENGMIERGEEIG